MIYYAHIGVVPIRHITRVEAYNINSSDSQADSRRKPTLYKQKVEANTFALFFSWRAPIIKAKDVRFFLQCTFTRKGVSMTENTYISDVLEGNDTKDRLDTEVKKVLSDKTVLAWILKYTTAEFKQYTIEKIKEC